MALVECPECKKQVSDTAKTCPSCGYKLDAEKVKKRNKTIKRSIMFILFASIVVGLSIYIPYEIERTKIAQIEFERWCEESDKPDSYLEVAYVILGLDRHWELIEEMIPELNVSVRINEINNVPFEQTDVYFNWTKYARRKTIINKSNQ